MKTLKLTHIGVAILIALSATHTSLGQRRTAPPRSPKTAATVPAPTFDTLLGTDTYKVYAEVRGVGQLIRSSSVSELLEPVMKLAGPPKEFKALVKWLNLHADAVMTSRMLVAAWPSNGKLPAALIAIEFASAEDAAKFSPQLNEFLPRMFPSEENTGDKSSAPKDKTATQPEQSYYLQQAGTLLFITPKPLTLKNLKPAGSKLLTEDPNFRTAHDRFSSESIFVYVDFRAIEKESEESQRLAIEEEKKREAEQATAPKAPPAEEESSSTSFSITDIAKPGTSAVVVPEAETQGEKAPTSNDEKQEAKDLSTALDAIAGSFFGGRSTWPDGVGVGLNLENDSFDLRALLVNEPGKKSDPIPFFTSLIPGPAISPQSPSLLPADTELMITMSLDLDQMYTALNNPPPRPWIRASTHTSVAGQPASPFAALEKKLGLKIKDDILPLLGNEIVLSLPVKTVVPSASAGPYATASASPSPGANQAAPSNSTFSPIIGLSLRDREGMRALLPRIIDGLGFKGASSMAQTEKREDTELVSLGNALSYAFLGDFLFISNDSNAVRHVVDSYLKRETLSSNTHFKNYTRWEPRQLQGEVYVSPVLMESYKSWATESNSVISDSTRDFLMRLSVLAEPVTYSLSNEGFGPLHEVHIPKNLVLMAVAGMAGESNPPPIVVNERRAMSALYTISWAEKEFKAKNSGNYASLDQLISENFVPKVILSTEGYTIELTVSGTQYQATAVPTEYGVTGRKSYFVDQSGVLRAADRTGAPATVSDRPAN